MPASPPCPLPVIGFQDAPPPDVTPARPASTPADAADGADAWPALGPEVPLYVVLNPRSGRPDTEGCAAALKAVLGEAGRRFELVTPRHPRQLVAAGRQAVARAQAEGGAVVAAGGDGTVNTLAGLVLPTGLPFGVLPQGTFNYVARAHGIPTDTEAAIRALVSPRVRPVQVGQVNGRVFLVNGSMGLYTQALDDRERFKQRLGRSRAVALLAGLFTALAPHRNWVIRLEVDGQETTVVTPTLFVGNNPLQLAQLGLVQPEGRREGLVAIMARPMSRLAMLGLLVRGAAGHFAESEAVTCLAFRRLTVEPRLPHRPGRLKIATDGETSWMRPPLCFEAAAQRLNLLVPG